MKRAIITISKTIVVFVVALVTSSVLAADRRVPADYPTIQDAINACQNSDTVTLATGTYSGPGNREINLNGKQITIRSTDPTDPAVVAATVIDCQRSGRGFIFRTGENDLSIITGLTITNGYGLLGGAIYCYNNSSPSITNSVISNNSAVFGGAIACSGSNTRPKIANCKITDNAALVGGGGIYLNSCSPEIANCVISKNSATNGAAIYSHNPGDPTVQNCTISQNSASKSAGAFYGYNASNLSINNSILWYNTAAATHEILIADIGAESSLSISYSNIQNRLKSVVGNPEVTWGPGNMDMDPAFTDITYSLDAAISPLPSHHLRKDSPCIDAGDPTFVALDQTDIDGDPRISGKKIDIGADEYEFPIIAAVALTPKTLNLTSNGNWINCSIELPAEYDITNIDTESILLNHSIKAARARIEILDNKLTVKFDRRSLQNALAAAQGQVSLNVTGRLTNDKIFEGTDNIRILDKIAKK